MRRLSGVMMTALGLLSSLPACDPPHAELPRGAASPLEELSTRGVKLNRIRVGSTAFVGGVQTARGRPLVKYLEQRTGVPTHVVEAASYEQLVEQFVSRKIDLAMLSALTYVKYATRLNGVPIATGTHSGSPTYLGLSLIHI